MTHTVTLSRWTYKPWPSSVPADRWTVLYTDPQTGRVYRVATRGTELECRRFAQTHGWTVEHVAAEGDES